MIVDVDGSKCNACGTCLPACPEGAIQLRGGLAVIDHQACSGCLACAQACPSGAIRPPEREPAPASPVRQEGDRLAVGNPAPAARAHPTPLLEFAIREVLPKLLDTLSLALEGRIERRAPSRAHARDLPPGSCAQAPEREQAPEPSRRSRRRRGRRPADRSSGRPRKGRWFSAHHERR